MGLEICEQIPDLDACVIPVGGGGLIAGSAVAIKTMYPHVTVIVSNYLLKCKCFYVIGSRVQIGPFVYS